MAYYNYSGIMWVHGLEEAQRTPIAFGTTMALWDADSETIYVKTMDTAGRESIRILDYTERKPETKDTPKEDYISREEFDSLKNELEALKNKLTSEA